MITLDPKTRLLARLPTPWPDDTRVQALSIEFMDGDWYMFLRAADGLVLNDTWHRTLDEAFEQGEIVYGLGRDAWSEVPEGTEVGAFMKN